MTFKYILKFSTVFCVLFWSVFGFAQNNTKKIAYRVLLLGDAGKLDDDTARVALAAAMSVNPADTNVTVFYLGDNLYPNGVADPEEVESVATINILKQQLAPFKDHKAKVYMIPGNHDWDKSGVHGWERISREAAEVENLNFSNVHFLPIGGCPGPEEIHLNDSVVVIIMDSQWWLHPFDKPGETAYCDCKTEDQVLFKIHDIAYRNRGKRIIFASHHPFRTHGVHGGYFTWKQHLFPFTDLKPYLYIPLPVIGSLYPIARGWFGNIQDVRHPVYRSMIRQVEEELAIDTDVIFVAGHDHNLQLLRDGSRNYIVSGAGSKSERVRKGKNSLFASTARGYAEILYFTDGTEQINYYKVGSEKFTSLPLYTNDLPYLPIKKTKATPLSEVKFTDSVVASPGAAYDSVSALHRFFLGGNYRHVWATPVKLPVFFIKTEKPGLVIEKLGGGKQSKSLHMKDSFGREWVLRTVQKDPAKVLPLGLRKSVARGIIQDQISTSHPFAAVTLPPMLDAIGVPHTNPKIMYVPDDPALGIYRQDFANTVCMLEEHDFGDDDKSYNTYKLWDKLEKDNDNIADENTLIKARLFDVVIADWDRHEDQWRWRKVDSAGKTYFFPIPKDRDQAYFVNTGVLPKIASRKWLEPKWQGFNKNVRDISGLIFNARNFDHANLNRLNEQDWKNAAHYLKTHLTDSVIEAGVRQMPDTLFALSGKEIIEKIKSRRDNIENTAMDFYRFISKVVEIPTSDKGEFFNIHYKDKGEIEITVRQLKSSGKLKDTIFHRTFDPKVTHEVRMYGRGDDDVFSVTGSGHSRIKLRMIGGGSNDSFYVDKDVHNKRRIIIYDRSDKKNEYPEPGRYTNRTSTINANNKYDVMGFKYNKLFPLFTGTFNKDDGILLGIGGQLTRQGFRSDPFKSQQSLMVGHSLATQATFFQYKGDFRNVLFRNYGIKADVDGHAPDNTINFFGIGNETVFLKRNQESAITYYRTRYNFITSRLMINKPVNKHFNVFGGLTAQYYQMDEKSNIGRFVIDYQPNLVYKDIYTRKVFGGLTGGFLLDTRNDPITPVRGIVWNTTISGLQKLDNGREAYGSFRSDMTIYTSFHADPRFIIVNKLGGGFLVGQPDYFQLMYLGGNTGLRGFRNYRFAGYNMAYHNIELRLKLFDFTSFLLPGSVGIIGFNDVGRVWARDEVSKTWHDGYGGGIYIIPAQLVYISGVLGFSAEGKLPYITFGYKF